MKAVISYNCGIVIFPHLSDTERKYWGECNKELGFAIKKTFTE